MNHIVSCNKNNKFVTVNNYNGNINECTDAA